MLARSFGYDFETDSWIEYTSHSMIHDEIEVIPYRIWALGYYDWEPQIYWEVACISDMTHALFCVEQYFSDERCLKNLTLFLNRYGFPCSRQSLCKISSKR